MDWSFQIITSATIKSLFWWRLKQNSQRRSQQYIVCYCRFMQGNYSYDRLWSTKSYKKRKANDEFGLSSEHIHHGGQAVSIFITKIVNKIIENKKTPLNIKSAISHPIPKNGKDNKKPGNSRGISICPIIEKVIDTISTDHQKAAIDECDTDLQFGFTTSRSPAYATLLLTEIINNAKGAKLPLYICTVDAQKAFDVVSTTKTVYWRSCSKLVAIEIWFIPRHEN